MIRICPECTHTTTRLGGRRRVKLELCLVCAERMRLEFGVTNAALDLELAVEPKKLNAEKRKADRGLEASARISALRERLRIA